MQVSFNPNVSFKQQIPAVCSAPAAVNIPVRTEPKTSGFREGISDVAKFFATMSEMTKASIKAVGYGLATGAVFTAGFWTFGTLPKAFKNGSFETIKHPIKNMSTKGKFITAAATLGVGAYHLICGKLKANQRTANVDHQLKTGHRAS